MERPEPGAETIPARALSPDGQDGVDHDDRLILWMLGLTPLKRLEALQGFVDGVMALRHARKLTQ